MNLMSNQVSYQPTQVSGSNGKSKFSSEKAPADAFSTILERNRSAQSKEVNQNKNIAKPDAKVETKVASEPAKEDGQQDQAEEALVIDEPAVLLLNEAILMAPLNAVINPAVPEMTQQAAASEVVPLTVVSSPQDATVLANLSQIGQVAKEKPLAQVAEQIQSETVGVSKTAPKVTITEAPVAAVVVDEKANLMQPLQQKGPGEGQATEPLKASNLSEGPAKENTLVMEKAVTVVVPEGKESVAESKVDAGLPQQGQTVVTDPVIIKVNDSSSLLQKQVYTQVSDKIVAHMDEGQSTFTMSLNPERLGKIDIKLVFEGGRVIVHVETQNPLTQHLLSNNLGELKSALQNSSIPVSEVHIAQYMGDANSGYDESKQFSQKEQGQGNSKNGLLEEEELDDENQKLILTETGLNYSV